ncbi:MAG TPA: hypothetical protein PK523_02415, partial [Elusimicrobiales bacterium]|nr:hypothetical protein [Elusimicrobiales bacterium]
MSGEDKRDNGETRDAMRPAALPRPAGSGRLSPQSVPGAPRPAGRIVSAAGAALLTLLSFTAAVFPQTTLYLHSEGATGAAPDSAQTTDSFGPNMPTEADNYRMDTTAGTESTDIEQLFTGSNDWNTDNDPSGYGEAARFVSPPLAAGTFDTGTNWTMLIYGVGGAPGVAWYLRGCAYVWKNDNSGIRGGVMLLNPTSHGPGLTTGTTAGPGAPFSGLIRNNEPSSNSITFQDGDRLVVEAEWHLVRWSTNGRSLQLLTDNATRPARLTCNNCTISFIPYLYNLSPADISVDLPMTLDGALFGTPAAGDGIQLGNKWIPYDDPTVVWTDDQITISDPPDDLTSGSAYIKYNGGASQTNSIAFRVQPTLSARTPSSRGQNAGGQWVTITGKSFVYNAVASFGAGITVSSTSWVSSTQLDVQISVSASAAQGARDVTVTNPDGAASTRPGWFTVNYRPGEALGGDNLTLSPKVRGADIASSTITITDATSRFMNGCSVAFSAAGVTVKQVTFDGGNQIRVEIGISGAPDYGAGDITVTNPDGGRTTKSGDFTINPKPVMDEAKAEGTDATPRNRLARGAANRLIWVKGSYIQSGAVVDFGLPSGPNGITKFGYGYYASSMSVNVSIGTSCPLGWQNFTVINPDGGYDSKVPGDSFFQITPSPSVTAVTDPAVLSFGQGATDRVLTISGSNFVSGAQVSFPEDGISVDWTSVLSANTLQCQVDIAPTADPDTIYDVRVTNLDWGSDTLADQVAVTYGPSFTTLQPVQLGQAAQGREVVINGANLQNGALVEFLDTIVNVTGYDYTHVPASFTVTVNVDGAAQTGTKDLRITNPDGGSFTSNWSPFTVSTRPAFGQLTTEVSGWTDNKLGAGAAAQNVRLQGNYFQAGLTQAGIVISTYTSCDTPDPDITINSFNRDSAGLISMELTVAPGAKTGGRYIKLTNPDYGRSISDSPLLYINAAPSIVSLTPGSLGQWASNYNLSISGGYLQAGIGLNDVVFSPGTGITINNVTPSPPDTLVVNISIDPEASPVDTPRDVTVFNPDGGSDTLPGAFTVKQRPRFRYAAPAVRGAGALNQVITLYGSGFVAGMGAYFEGGATGKVQPYPAAASLQNSATAQVTISISTDAAAGDKFIRLQNTDEGYDIVYSTFTVNPAPVISAVSPGNRGQGANYQDIKIDLVSGYQSGCTADLGADVEISSYTYHPSSFTVHVGTISETATLGA